MFSETQLMRQWEVPAMDERPKKPSDTRMQHQLSSSYLKTALSSVTHSHHAYN
ncbi:hypothetical protein XF_0070 [Xylella fastidiosa 9a5c]|uniref:Uncharacterized protein n=1 Tax=Xylella fastidiosa (strain 9a5c) TaxID=160492 RepID=Q9PH74_XYLFA|nr:hypothetical protein XF_0070 [Xylella fastidiosa 9a5c]